MKNKSKGILFLFVRTVIFDPVIHNFNNETTMIGFKHTRA